MSTWRQHMPEGMILRSENSASNLSDPGDELSLANYCAEHAPEIKGNAVPVPLAVFNDYASWFVEQAGREGRGRDGAPPRASGTARFTLELENGEVVKARRVVMAIGVSHFSYVPAPFSQLPPELVLPHVALRPPRRVRRPGRHHHRRGPVGARDRRAAPRARRDRAVPRATPAGSDGTACPIPPDRPLGERLRMPAAGMGAGWEPWLFEHLPRVFRRLPAEERVRIATQRFGPTGAWWLRPRVEGIVPLLLGRVVRSVHPEEGGVRLEVDGPDGHETYQSNHVIAATGYKVDLDRLTFLDSALRDQLELSGRSPVLGKGFESSVPGCTSSAWRRRRATGR